MTTTKKNPNNKRPPTQFPHPLKKQKNKQKNQPPKKP